MCPMTKGKLPNCPMSITKFMYNNIIRFSSDSFSDHSKGKREHVVLNFGNGFSSSLHWKRKIEGVRRDVEKEFRSSIIKCHVELVIMSVAMSCTTSLTIPYTFTFIPKNSSNFTSRRTKV